MPPCPSNQPLLWLFIDMNSFFASAEQHLRPELRGHPVGIIPVESEGTCVIAASREAKIRGIRMGTGVREARTLCPGIHLVKARPAEYVSLHEAVARSIDLHVPVHKAYSIDEWGVRLLGRQCEPEVAMALARRIKRQLLTDFSPALTCSIGIAPTRLLAKIASDLQKPDGLTVLHAHEVPERLAQWTLRDLCGIGSGMAERLKERGIGTVADLWKLDRRQSIAAWGSVAGAQWWAGFHGYDEPEQATKRSSMSHANVLEPKFRNDRDARGILTRLVCRLGRRLRTEGYLAGALSVSVSYTDGTSFGATSELPQVDDTRTLLYTFSKLWERRRSSRTQPLQVGVVVSGLVPADQASGQLFEHANRDGRLSSAMDKINGKWGLSSLYVGSMHAYRHHMDDKIAFGRIPSRVWKEQC